MRGLLLLLTLAGLAAAKTPIATVTAAKSVSVNGIDISTQGVPKWPLVSGDVVTTTADPAIVTLTDGSTFMLSQNSSVRVQQCGPMEVEVLLGTTTYRFAPASKARLCALGHPITAAAMTEGSLTIESPDKAVLRAPDQRLVSLPSGDCSCTQSSHKGIIILVIAGAAAAALALGLALTLPGPVSPSGSPTS